jgi:hypothetical protein
MDNKVVTHATVTLLQEAVMVCWVVRGGLALVLMVVNLEEQIIGEYLEALQAVVQVVLVL